MARVLVVEDDPSIRDMVALVLEQRGHEVTVAVDGEAAVERFFQVRPDIVVLDLRLPRRNGLEVCRRVRAVSSTPILILTSLAGEDDVAFGLRLGADDYVTKPFSTKVLAARVEALLRRVTLQPSQEDRIVVGDLEVDIGRCEVRRGGHRLDLTPTEFRLLSHLAANAGRVLGARELLWRVQSYDAEEREAQAIIKVHMSHLRNKVEPDPQQPRYIFSVRGFGYMLSSGG